MSSAEGHPAMVYRGPEKGGTNSGEELKKARVSCTSFEIYISSFSILS